MSNGYVISHSEIETAQKIETGHEIAEFERISRVFFLLLYQTVE